MPTLHLPSERREFFADATTGQWSIFKDDESILPYTVDWSRVLLGSDTISSAAWVCSGVSSQAESNTSTTTTIKLSRTGGEAKCTITTAGGYTHVRRLQFVAMDA